MALVLDSRFLLAHTFPPSGEDRERIRRFTARVLAGERLVVPSVVVVEYVKVAGRRIGRAAALARLNAWFSAGAEFAPLSRESAVRAGELVLSHPNVPLADAAIASVALSVRGKVVSDDPHFDELGVKRVWYR